MLLRNLSCGHITTVNWGSGGAAKIFNTAMSIPWFLQLFWLCAQTSGEVLPCGLVRGGKKSAPDPLWVGRVGHVCPRCLLHGLLVDLVFGEGNWPQRADSQRRRDVDLWQRRLRCWRGTRGGCSAAGEDVWGETDEKELKVCQSIKMPTLNDFCFVFFTTECCLFPDFLFLDNRGERIKVRVWSER